jgi:hypothetical protein
VSLFGRWQLLRKYYFSLPVRGLKKAIWRLRAGRFSLLAASCAAGQLPIAG